MESLISSYLSRWLGLPCSLSSTTLYWRSNKLQLPFYKITRDTKVTMVGIQVHTDRKRRAHKELESAEPQLRHKVIVWMVASGRARLGNLPTLCYDKTQETCGGTVQFMEEDHVIHVRL